MKKPYRHQWVKQADFAEHVNLSARRIREMRDEGILPSECFGDDGKVSQDLARVEYIRHLRDVAAGRKTEGEDGEVIDPAIEKAKLTREQTIKTAHEARLKEIAVSKAEGEIIEVSAVDQVLGTVINHAKAKLQALPVRLTKEIAGLDKSDLKTIEEVIHEVLSTMASDAPDLMQDAVDQEIAKHA